MKQKPTGEKVFLEISFGVFYEIVNEVYSETFWEMSPEYRFNKIKNAFSIYAELLNYKPVKEVAEMHNSLRDCGVGRLLGVKLFKVIRHLLLHFPFFNTWGEFWFNKSLVTWERKGLIHDFFKKHSGDGGIRFTYTENTTKQELSVDILLPNSYLQDEKIYLKDIIPEETGIKLCIGLMCDVVAPFYAAMVVDSSEEKGAEI